MQFPFLWQAALLYFSVAYLCQSSPIWDLGLASSVQEPSPKAELSSRDNSRPPHYLISQSGLASWTDDSTNFGIHLDVSDCLGIARDTIVGDYTFAENGSTVHDVTADAIFADELYIRKHNDDFDGARLRHLSRNAKESIAEIETAYKAAALKTTGHDELRKLLQLDEILDEIRRQVRVGAAWSAYIGPRIGSAFLMGHIVAYYENAATRNMTGFDKLGLQFQYALGAASFVFAVDRVLERYLRLRPARPEDWFRDSLMVVFMFIAWNRSMSRHFAEVDAYRAANAAANTDTNVVIVASEDWPLNEGKAEVDLGAIATEAESLRTGRLLSETKGPEEVTLATPEDIEAVHTTETTLQQQNKCGG